MAAEIIISSEVSGFMVHQNKFRLALRQNFLMIMTLDDRIATGNFFLKKLKSTIILLHHLSVVLLVNKSTGVQCRYHSRN